MSGYTRTAIQSFVANRLHDAFEKLVEGGITPENSAEFMGALPDFLNEFIIGEVSTTHNPKNPGPVTIKFTPIAE